MLPTNPAEKVLPYGGGLTSKKSEMTKMFDNIAKRYDFLNRLLSMGIDKGWRKQLVKLVIKENPDNILDMATGTADLAISLAKSTTATITGVDISEGMLSIGKQKVLTAKLQGRVDLLVGAAENIPFPDNYFDVATVSFGVRNFEETLTGLGEIRRVLKSGGQLLVLDFSKPTSFPVKQFYSIYFKYLLPAIGGLISRDKKAYKYLFDSVEAFPSGKEFISLLKQVEFTDTTCKPLTFGISSIYTARK